MVKTAGGYILKQQFYTNEPDAPVNRCMQNVKVNIIYRLTATLFILFCFVGCASETQKTTIDTTQRQLTSFKSWGKDDTSKNSIFLQLPGSDLCNLKYIKARLKHGAGCTPMRNFIITIYTDDDGYWLTSDDFRFLENDFNSINDTIIEKSIYPDSCKFRSFTTNMEVGYQALQRIICSSKRVAVSANMDDMALLKNPLSSSSLRYSNLIEIIRE